jgi:hypothetical protein
MDDSSLQLKCRLLWTLCRKHSWASPLSITTLVNLALDRSEQGRGRLLVQELLAEPYVERRAGDGYRIKNDPDSQALAASRLRRTCDYRPIQIEATLSRFEQAGGFDAYSEAGIAEILDSWYDGDRC